MFWILEKDSGHQALQVQNACAEVVRVRDRPSTCTALARHLHSRELFVALDGKSYGFWVSRELDPDHVQWLVLASDQVLLLDAGTWHHGPIPLGSDEGTYLIVVRAGTGVHDATYSPLSRAIDPPP